MPFLMVRVILDIICFSKCDVFQIFFLELLNSVFLCQKHKYCLSNINYEKTSNVDNWDWNLFKQTTSTKTSNNKIVKTNNENKYKITSKSETKQITK